MQKDRYDKHDPRNNRANKKTAQDVISTRKTARRAVEKKRARTIDRPVSIFDIKKTQKTQQEEIQLADGTIINTQTGRTTNKQEQKQTQVLEHYNELVTNALTDESRNNKFIDDLPEEPARIQSCALIAVYSLFGLTQGAIAQALGLSEKHVVSLKASVQYTELQRGIVDNIIETIASNVRGRFLQYADEALQTQVDIMRDFAVADSVRAAVSNQILDRAGLRPDDVIQSKLEEAEGGLRIEIVDRTDTQDTQDTQLQ
jgi:hypothetical protein